MRTRADSSDFGTDGATADIVHGKTHEIPETRQIGNIYWIIIARSCCFWENRID
jgi:hypothetical protein